MTDITWLLSKALSSHGVTQISNSDRRSWDLDEFSKESYRINSHITSLQTYLRTIRQPYLSLSSSKGQSSLNNQGSDRDRRVLSDKQREEVDTESKGSLRELNAAISTLDKAEEIRYDTELTILQKRRDKRGFGSLGRWAAGGSAIEKSEDELAEEAKIDGVKAHRESVIWYLRRRLEACGEAQRSMMEIRIKREVEKSKSMLYKAKGAQLPTGISPEELVHTPTNRSVRSSSIKQYDDETSKDIMNTLSPEQLQLFAEENESMVKHFEDTLDQVRTAERSLVEISELQTTLAGNLEIQAAHIEHLEENISSTTENVTAGNQQLKRATERKSTAKYVFYASCVFSGLLVIYDLII